MAETPDQIVTRLRRQLSELERQMGSGVVTVESPDGGRVTYHSYAEKQTARSDLLRRIREAEATASGTPRRRRTRRVVMIGASGL